MRTFRTCPERSRRVHTQAVQISNSFKGCGKSQRKVLVGAPCFSKGKLDFSPAEKESILKWTSAPGFSTPALKRVIKAEFFPER